MTLGLYSSLKDLDRGIAEAYKEAVGPKFLGLIDADEAEEIFSKAVDGKKGKKITPKEAKALVLILDANEFTDGARERLIELIKEERAALYTGTRRKLTGKKLNDIKAALSSDTVQHINFKNFQGHPYLPTYYSVIWRLIVDDKIEVFELDVHDLNKAAGLGGALWRSSSDDLYVYKTQHSKSWTALVVHEATHAIQDWMDRKGVEVRHIEADAYTAQGIVCHTIGVRQSKDSDHPVAVAYHGTSRLVFEGGKTKSGTFGDEFKKAYNALMQSVSKLPLYAHKANEDRDFSEDREGKSERAIFKNLHKKLKKKKKQ